MGKNTLRKEFSNMYGEGKPLNSNKTTNNLLKNIVVPNEPGNENLNVNRKHYNTDALTSNVGSPKAEKDRPSIVIPEMKPPTMSFWSIIVLFFIILGITAVYFLKDPIVSFFKSVEAKLEKADNLEKKFNDFIKSFEDKKKEDNEKVTQATQKVDSIKKDLEETKKKEEEKDKGGVKDLNNNLDKLSGYSKDQVATADGFCYIGYDNGQRECTEIYSGEVCMSGKIFPTLATCTDPKLRV
jgi:hypothetical protein